MDFSEWLVSELEKREWTNADLARHANISRGSISNILSGLRQPGVDICESIAKAFKISPDIVFRKAGLLPADVEIDEKTKELVHLVSMMDDDGKDEQLDYARMKLEKQEREEKKVAKASRDSQRVRKIE